MTSLGWTLYSMIQEERQGGKLEEAQAHLKELGAIDFELVHKGAFLRSQYERLQRQLDPTRLEFDQIIALSKQPGQAVEAYCQASRLHSQGRLDMALYEQYGWIIYRVIRQLRDDPRQLSFVQELFRFCVQGIPIKKPSPLYSSILTLALHYHRDHPQQFDLHDFLTLWGINNFTPEDFQPRFFDGKQHQPLLCNVLAALALANPEDELLETCLATFGRGREELFRKAIYNALYVANKLNPDPHRAEALYRWYAAHLCTQGASPLHSRMIQSALFFMRDEHAPLLVPFYLKWRQSPFCEADWQSEIRGRKPLVVRTVHEVCKLIKAHPDDCREAVQPLYEDVTRILARIPNEWLAFYKAFLCLMLGRKDEAHSLLFDFVRVNMKQSYAWRYLALYGNIPDISLKTSLLCKALLCLLDSQAQANSAAAEQTADQAAGQSAGQVADQAAGRAAGTWDDDAGEEDESGEAAERAAEQAAASRDRQLFTVRLLLAASLAEEDLSAQARYELDACSQILAQKRVEANEEYATLSDRLADVTPVENTRAFYEERAGAAEAFVYTDLEWTPYVLVDKFTREDKGEMLVFLDSDGTRIILPAKAFPCLEGAAVGEGFDFRMNKSVRKVLQCNKSRRALWQGMPESFGIINKIDPVKGCMWISLPDESIRYKDWQSFSENSGVALRFYSRPVHSEFRKEIVSIRPVEREEALKPFYHAEASIEAINRDGEIFYWKSKDQQHSGRIRVPDKDKLDLLNEGDDLLVVFSLFKDRRGLWQTCALDWQLQGRRSDQDF